MADKKDNLKKFTKRDASEKGRKGGIVSAARRKSIKSFKDACKLFCEIKQPEEIEKKIRDQFPDMQDQEINGFIAMVFAQREKALSGDTRAFEAVRDTAGEKPKDVHEVKMSWSDIVRAAHND